VLPPHSSIFISSPTSKKSQYPNPFPQNFLISPPQRNIHPPIMTSWIHLPLEIRQMILELIVAASDHRRKSSYATVSLEFQEFFETRNFRSLRIQSSCLDDLDRMVRGKWGGRRVVYVERICLCVDPDRQQGWRKYIPAHSPPPLVLYLNFTNTSLARRITGTKPVFQTS